MKYYLNKLDDDYQIYGEVNGFAIRKYEKGIYSYIVSIRFFKDKKLIKVTIGANDQTIRNKEGILKRINRIITEEI